MTLLISEKVLLDLLQVALWGKTPEAACNYDISADTWRDIYTLAVRQGVQAIAFDGIMHLPATASLPPQDLRLQWAVNVKAKEIRYNQFVGAVTELNELYRRQKLKMMLLKGVGLASLYPVPSHRESGDIDIWLFGEYERGNRLMLNLNKKIYDFGEKHTASYYKKIPVENHKTFLNVRRFKLDRKLEAVLHGILDTEANEVLSVGETEQILLPPPTFNLIFIVRHMATHFPREGVVLRHLCDWALFLYTHKGRYDGEKMAAVFRNTAMTRMVNVFTQLAVDYIGMPPEYAPVAGKGRDAELEERVFADILRPAYRSRGASKKALRTIVWKCRRFLGEQWKYKLIYGESLPLRAVLSLCWHFRNSRNLFRGR